MNLELLLKQREQILRIASKHGASNLQIFGSIARRENTSKSDINLLAELAPQCTLLDQIALIQELEEFLGYSVDVVEPDDSVHNLIRNQVLEEAIPL